MSSTPNDSLFTFGMVVGQQLHEASKHLTVSATSESPSHDKGRPGQVAPCARSILISFPQVLASRFWQRSYLCLWYTNVYVRRAREELSL